VGTGVISTIGFILLAGGLIVAFLVVGLFISNSIVFRVQQSTATYLAGAIIAIACMTLGSLLIVSERP
jgi:hypothetical protein